MLGYLSVVKVVFMVKDTSSANDERLAGWMAEAEDVVAADAVLHGARNVRVLRPPAHSDHYVLRRQLLLRSILHRRNNRVRILKLSQTIDIFNFLIPKINPGYPVHGFNVVLYRFCE